MNDIDLVNASVTYNGVTIGGSSAQYKSLPPRFKLGYRVLTDETRRVVKGLQYTLSVQTIFYEDNQAALAANQQAIRAALSAQAKKLELRGLGLGLDTINDIMGGPHPLGIPEMRMLSERAWELLWSVEFTINDCLSTGTTAQTLVGFNYTTNWSNDFEGNCTRSISGRYEIVHLRNPNAPKTPVSRAEHSRPKITVTVPDGFRRLQNVWQESADKKMGEFTVVDQQLAGDPLPVDIIEASGSESFTTSPLKWSEAMSTLSVNLRVAPGKSRTAAGLWFLTAAMTKQASIAAALPDTSQVIPESLQITAGKFHDSRTMAASISWKIVGCTRQYLTSGGIWSPIAANSHTQWRASIESLWANRGNATVVSALNDDVILDLCDSRETVNIGNDSATLPSMNPAAELSMTCPVVAADGGWLGYDLRVRVLREDHQTQHRRAVSYSPSASVSDASDGYVPVGGPSYTTTDDTEHVVEYNGLPSTLVVLQFRAKRYRLMPVMPEIVSVAGKDAVLIEQDGTNPYGIGDLMGCPVYAMAGYRIYRVTGFVATIRSNGQKTMCSDRTTPGSY